MIFVKCINVKYNAKLFQLKPFNNQRSTDPVHRTGGSTTAPACAATGCHSPSASTLLDLCPAAACTVQCCLTERNKVLPYKILQNEYPLKPDVEFIDNRGRLPFAPQSGRVLAHSELKILLVSGCF